MTSMVNFRAEDDLLAAIDAARGKVSRSVWLREVVAHAAGCRESPHPVRALALQPVAQRDGSPTGGCLHPKAGWKKLPFSTVCGVCGVRVR